VAPVWAVEAVWLCRIAKLGGTTDLRPILGRRSFRSPKWIARGGETTEWDADHPEKNCMKTDEEE